MVEGARLKTDSVDISILFFNLEIIIFSFLEFRKKGFKVIVPDLVNPNQSWLNLRVIRCKCSVF